MIAAILTVGLAYLIGSVPTGYLLGYFAGVDVRKEGSGNVGATNVARVAGKRLGMLTLLGDAAKGFFPVLLALQISLGMAATAVVGLAAFLGHLYPVFLNFRGGKGVATALGVLLALTPPATGVLLVVFLVVALTTRIVSLASMSAAATTPVAVWLLGYPAPLVGVALIMGLMVIWRHEENIHRLRLGTEPKFKL